MGGGVEGARAKTVRLGGAQALIYVLATWTGIRKGELVRLRCCGLDLVGGRLTVTAASAKSRRVQTVEVHPRVVEALAAARPRPSTSSSRGSTRSTSRVAARSMRT
jgi:integrase